MESIPDFESWYLIFGLFHFGVMRSKLDFWPVTSIDNDSGLYKNLVFIL